MDHLEITNYIHDGTDSNIRGYHCYDVGCIYSDKKGNRWEYDADGNKYDLNKE